MMLQVEIEGKVWKFEIAAGETRAGGRGGVFTLTREGRTVSVNAQLLDRGVLSLVIGGRAYRCIRHSGAEGPAIAIEGRQLAYSVADPRSLKARRVRADDAQGPRPVKASMPGRVVRVLVERGEAVEAQQALLVIEAMKMQNEVKAPKAGRVSELRVSAGEAVSTGQVLATVE